MGAIEGLASESTMKTAVKSERDLVSGMRIDLFVHGLRRLRTLQLMFRLKQAPHWSMPAPRSTRSRLDFACASVYSPFPS